MVGTLRRWVVPQAVLTVLAVVFLAPLGIAVRVALQGQGLGNFVAVLKVPLFPRFFLNSAIVTAASVVAVLILTSLAAFAFSKLNMPGKNVLFGALLVGLMMPSMALTVPLFLEIRALNLFDNYLALIIPYTALFSPFALLLSKNFVDGIPDELIDAARVDGCASRQIWWHVVRPLSAPILVVAAVIVFLFSWNEYFLPLLFMQSDDMQMITQAPTFFQHQYTQDTGKIFAALVLMSIPVVALYLALQRHVEAGLMSGAER